mgnify:FL=1
MNVRFVYVTVGGKDEAATIGKELVTSGLVACVNILDNMRALYMWDGKLQDDAEVVLIAKTTEARIPELVEKIRSLHSDDCPCVLALPVMGGHQPFLDWIAQEVG